ncbi:MAG: hypothetical protein M1816_000782 [Peltula sp. TS41687]|nr:MAG: hypothetical protein M1816_000782 [Peltula sp. TS41687]
MPPTDDIYYPALEDVEEEEEEEEEEADLPTIPATSTTSDYGSDLDSEDDDLLNELLSRISPLTTNTRAIPISTHDDSGLVEINNHHHHNNKNNNGKTRGETQTPQRILGRQDRSDAKDDDDELEVARKIMWEEVADDQLDHGRRLGEECFCVSRLLSLFAQIANPTVGKRLVKSEGSFAEEEEDKSSTTTTTTTQAETAVVTAPTTSTSTSTDNGIDPQSPLARFRSPPKKPLSVTDLISPSWCELQYWYTLSKYGRKPATAAMRQGTAAHKVLEEQVHTTVPVRTHTREDSWGLRIWNIVQGLRSLRETGLTREMEVWGVIDGAVVRGCIDELSDRCPDRVLEADASWTDHDVDRVEGTGLPGVQRTLDSYLMSSARGVGVDGGDETEGEEKDEEEKKDLRPPPISSSSSSRKIYITDVKTRTNQKIPGPIAFRPTYLQLMIYHRLLSDLASNRVDPDTLFARFRLDPSARFTDAFIAEVGSLNDSHSHETDVPLPSSSSGGHDSLDMLTQHNTLRSLWELMMSSFHETFPLGRSSIGDVLQAEYRSQRDGGILGSKTFLMDEGSLQAYLDEGMSWWKGRREAMGVPIEEAYKCRMCEFADGCEWRNGKVEEAMQNYRERTKSVV